MKNNLIYTLIVIISILGYSCDEDDNGQEYIKPPIGEGVYDNLHAPEGGDFVKLKFVPDPSTPKALITDSENNWDIAFRGTMIIVNGGVKTGSGNEPERVSSPQISAYIDILNMKYINVIKSENLEIYGENQDKAGQPKIPNISGQGWFEDDGTYITPLEDKTIVLRTIDDYYVKIGMYSYYKDAAPPENSSKDDQGYYSFQYSINTRLGDYYLD
ncbi:MAG: hypothetical protein CMC16_00350 [Flavobacteriaceae bacterium]|nr:hypothetical protein [Flavobacteriaceae bacterium]